MESQPNVDQPATYQIQVRGRLAGNWTDWFEGMALGTAQRSDGTTVTTLVGPLDQAALYGILRRIRDLGLPLVEVSQVTAPS